MGNFIITRDAATRMINADKEVREAASRGKDIDKKLRAEKEQAVREKQRKISQLVPRLKKAEEPYLRAVANMLEMKDVSREALEHDDKLRGTKIKCEAALKQAETDFLPLAAKYLELTGQHWMTNPQKKHVIRVFEKLAAKHPVSAKDIGRSEGYMVIIYKGKDRKPPHREYTMIIPVYFRGGDMAIEAVFGPYWAAQINDGDAFRNEPPGPAVIDVTDLSKVHPQWLREALMQLQANEKEADRKKHFEEAQIAALTDSVTISVADATLHGVSGTILVDQPWMDYSKDKPQEIRVKFLGFATGGRYLTVIDWPTAYGEEEGKNEAVENALANLFGDEETADMNDRLRPLIAGALIEEQKNKTESPLADGTPIDKISGIPQQALIDAVARKYRTMENLVSLIDMGEDVIDLVLADLQTIDGVAEGRAKTIIEAFRSYEAETPAKAEAPVADAAEAEAPSVDTTEEPPVSEDKKLVKAGMSLKDACLAAGLKPTGDSKGEGTKKDA